MEVRDKVLVVEDDAAICNVITAVLTTNRYEVITAAGGREADSLIRSHCPDLVLLDLGLPDMDGLEIIRRVREWSQLPVVVVSARSQEADKVAALDAGADDYIVKPFGAAELLGVLFTGSLPAERRATSDGRRNMGIGLSVCSTIVEAHGGSMDVRNLPEGGAEFRFSLPLEEKEGTDGSER